MLVNLEKPLTMLQIRTASDHFIVWFEGSQCTNYYVSVYPGHWPYSDVLMPFLISFESVLLPDYKYAKINKLILIFDKFII